MVVSFYHPERENRLLEISPLEPHLQSTKVSTCRIDLVWHEICLKSTTVNIYAWILESATINLYFQIATEVQTSESQFFHNVEETFSEM
jgi:hypothetical protein